jgi:hypothetical protein
MSFELSFIKVHVTEIPCRISHHLISEVRRFGIAPFSACSYGFRVDLRSELDGGNEAVTASAIPALQENSVYSSDDSSLPEIQRRHRCRCAVPMV